jgi:hypothetical protein
MNRRDMHGNKKGQPSWDPEGFALVIAKDQDGEMKCTFGICINNDL